jgi:hypothetical protein
MTEFRFENTLTMTESLYVALFGVVSPRRRSRSIRMIALAAVGILFLFTSYTLILGVILLGFFIMAVFVPKLLPVGARRQFRQHEYLRDAITYGVTDQRLWVKSVRVEASASWSMLKVWREHETEGWLVLSSSGIPPVFLSLARLRQEGLYGRVRALAASNAPEYGKSNQ